LLPEYTQVKENSKILVAGHSHVHALQIGWKNPPKSIDEEVSFFNIKACAKPIPDTGVPAGKWPSGGGKYIDPEEVVEKFTQAVHGTDALVLLIQGNEHHALGLANSDHDLPNLSAELTRRAGRTIGNWIDLLLPHIPYGEVVAVLTPPPPLKEDELILERPGIYRDVLAERGIRDSSERFELWKLQCQATKNEAEKRGLRFVKLPRDVFSPEGFLRTDLAGSDPIHGNAQYGKIVLEHAIKTLRTIHADPGSSPRPRKTGGHPYRNLPDTSYWKQSISIPPREDVDPVVNPPFLISPTDAVATAGSCFAQHISRRLRDGGFNFLNMEPMDGVGNNGRKRVAYDFSARYGNVYTARQLLQLFDRAFGYFKPLDIAWERDDGTLCDPFRPRIEEGGFSKIEDLLRDREEHLRAVKEMFERLDIFVFTLGLTECWISRLDGAAFPIAPGVAGGMFEPDRYAFKNFSASEVASDLRTFLHKLRHVNKNCRVILTVSPVPLVATYEARHVLVSTIYSKSVLRVAAEEVANSEPMVYYFPSYEIIVGPHSRGEYFESDRRAVTKTGVDHVMGVFMRRMTNLEDTASTTDGHHIASHALDQMQEMADAACDEELLAKGESSS
jgi:hypothetical protein